MKKIFAYKWTGYALFFILGLGISLTGTFALAKKQSNSLTSPTTMCKPTGSSQNDINAENNCDYIYGKLESMENTLKNIISNQNEDHEHLHDIIRYLGHVPQ